MSENNESTVNNDNGVTYTPTEGWQIKGVVWSIGLAAEVSVIGHATDQSDDRWLVSRDLDGDGSPDTAITRYGSDLVPAMKAGSVVWINVEENGEQVRTYAIVVERNMHGIYVHTGYTMKYNSGYVHIPWAHVRERVNQHGLGEFTYVDDLTASLVTGLHSHWRDALAEKSRAERDTRMAENRIESFKGEVASKMKELAVEHGWCSVAREGLAELGIDWPTTRWAVPVTFTGTVYINADDSDHAEERVRYLIDGITVNMSGEENGEDPEEGSEFDKEIGNAESYED